MSEPARVLIVDATAPRPYCDETLASGGLGGTEATVVRVARDLARTRSVVVAQRVRGTTHRSASGVHYVPYRHGERIGARRADALIVVRAHKLLPKLRRANPGVPMFLWMHCVPGRHVRSLARIAVETSTTVLGVSRFHEDQMRRFFAEHDPTTAGALDLRFVYNPIDDELEADGTASDPDKLLFLSSPHKGLEQVLDTFVWLRERVPSLKLYLANPGYLERRLPEIEGVTPLGTLPHDEVIRHLRSSLCLFYPQSTFRETFGLVFAESLAVGTPVLAHPIGAAPEIVADDRQLCDVTDRECVLRRIVAWRSGQRPTVSLRAQFRRSHVRWAWEALLSRSAVSLRRTNRSTEVTWMTG